MNLATAVNLFPTPTASRTGDYTVDGKTKKVRMSLQGAAKLMPTPKARDWKGQTQRGEYAPGDGICNFLGITSGQLNPEWVEWLMGYPTGWTALKSSGTRSSRRSSTASAESSKRSRKRKPSGESDEQKQKP